ncbi:sporulation protein YqfD [Bengtsoniella intestinalis]|uniref:sporulation protein YqfD n=1 Tax=Bengtsoniella intestinalis TaxID=3073143 RepID=UPI00391F5608
MRSVVNRLQGQVTVEVESPYPERILNLCSVHNLAFWHVEWRTPSTFCCTLSRRDWKKLRRLCHGLECQLTARRQRGLPFFVGRFRHRQWLVGSLVVGLFTLIMGSFFIWDFQIYGNETVSDQTILRALERQGITMGTFGFSVDSEDLRNHILLEIPEISWIAVNVSGCRAYVQIHERVPEPELVTQTEPSNLVASRDGLVLQVSALGGKAMVLTGTTVQQGQLLISGVWDTDTFGARLFTSLGTVTARTWHTYTTQFPTTVTQKVPTGACVTCYGLVFGTNRINFFLNSSIPQGNCDKISTRTQWDFFGLPLPVFTVRETYVFYDPVAVTLTAQMAQELGETLLKEHLLSQLAEGGSVSSAITSVQQTTDGFAVTLRAECVEEIATSVPILTD